MSASSIEERLALRMADVVRGRDAMHHYQSGILVPFLKANPYSGAFVDMGLGKTVSLATVIVDLLADFEYEHVLIIAPLKVAAETWPTEFTLWEHLAPYDVQLIHARDDDPALDRARTKAKIKAKADAAFWELPKAQASKYVEHKAQRAETAAREKIRRLATHSKTTIHVISRDWIEWLVNYWGPHWPYKCVIVDESSSFKDHKSGRFKALANVRKGVKNKPPLIERLHILTATPAAETYEHFFAQMFLLDLGKRLGTHITPFRKRYFNENRWSRKWEIRPGAQEEILEKIADICLVMKAEDYLKDLPLPVIVERPVILGAAEMKIYNTLEEKFIVTVPDGSEVVAETAAALSAKLLQLASGVLYETRVLEDWDTGDLSKVTHVHQLHDHKIDELKLIVEESGGAPLLVAYHFKSTLARLQKAFPKAVTMDKAGRCVKSWNKGKIPMLLVHPQSAGHGLNLQHGGHHLVFFDIPWSLELFLQTVGRLARQGQLHPVIVQLLVAKGTLDELVAGCQQNKKDAQDDMFRRLKRLIKRHRQLSAA